ncbi:SPOSA6832_00338 [Sporobolomyces salmonicolor]|uniref:SPOSA6832_00338-mRNA-1:cds n=1 Tax=Sporidiobolus salmonicolor TaxID=5005 RepID=A0A0D6EFT2_SPOSA|nr:SPOSA6832_00338 [Sporobolomyces salmonicolor]
MVPVPVWLDCDPGHDDAIAILLSLHLNEINLLGISTVHGNASLKDTTREALLAVGSLRPISPGSSVAVNAIRCLLSFGSPEQAAKVPVYSGATKPLLRYVKHDAEIHGDDGLGGVEGLLSAQDPTVQAKLAETKGKNAVLAMAHATRSLQDGQQIAIVATGTLTNVALFVTMFPELVREKVSQIVLMGGAEGRGNRSPTAGESALRRLKVEYSRLALPQNSTSYAIRRQAAAIVFDAEVKVVMVPLNVTHTALFRTSDHDALLVPPSALPELTSAVAASPSRAHTPLRHSLSTLLMFFASTYASVFDFQDGPPIHDALCIAYLAKPELFRGKRYRVDVELDGKWTAGTTSVDLWDYRKDELTEWKKDPESRESWGKFGKNVFVLMELDVPAFWATFQECVDSADKVSPLNNVKQ